MGARLVRAPRDGPPSLLKCDKALVRCDLQPTQTATTAENDGTERSNGDGAERSGAERSGAERSGAERSRAGIGAGQRHEAANIDGSKDNFTFSYTRHYIASSRVEFVGELTHELPTLLLACSLNGR